MEADIEGILCAAISQILRETKCVMPRLHLWSELIHQHDEYDVISTSDLIYLLAMSSISQHERIASSAQHVMVYLMTYSSDYGN